MNKISKILLWLALFLFLALYPKIFGVYYTNVAVTFAIFAVYAVSCNMLLGYTGLLSFGHTIFFGAGGYGTALALKHIEGIALLPAIMIGFLAAMAFAIILAPLVVRVSGTAFCMLHLALGQVMYVMAQKLRNITGGEDGIGCIPPDLNILNLYVIRLKDSPENFYYFAFIVLGLCILLMWYFTKTPFAQVQVGMRDNSKRVDYLGYNVTKSKALIYIISGAFAGVAGSIYGLSHTMVSVEGSLSVSVAFKPVIAIVVGGLGGFFGPVLGAAIIQLIEELVVRFTERVELVTGCILILIIMFAPSGAIGWISYLKGKFLQTRQIKI